MKNNKNLITYLLFGYFLYLIFIISGLIKVFEIIITLIIYSIITFFIYYSWKKFRKKDFLEFNDFLKLFIYKICLFTYTIIIIIGAFAYYSNEIKPANMPEYTITNGKKIVVFQAMSHIAKKQFYNEVENNIRTFKSNSGVYFFEGVKSGTKESNDKFDAALGVNFTPDLYKHMSRLYGVTFQDNDKFLGLVNNLDFNVDLDMDQIIKVYEKKVKTSNIKKSDNKEILNASELILEQLNQLKDNELKILIYINQAILNTIIKNDNQAKNLLKKFGNQNLFDVILEERNDNLVKEIIKSKYDKIYITYGLLHFDGVLELLQKNDKNWKIINTRNLYPVK